MYIPYRARRFLSWDVDSTQELINVVNARINEWVTARNQKDNGKVLLIDTTNFFDDPNKYAEFLNIKIPVLVEDLVCTDGLHPSP